MKPIIIAIVGSSGCGKTTLTQHLSQVAKIPSVVSWTARPMRKGERSGREHWFTTTNFVPPRDQMIAHTIFSGFDYWVTRKDIQDLGNVMTYVIDEKGLMMLLEEHGEDYNIVPVLIKRDEDKLINDVGVKRVRRDIGRIRIDERTYEYIIDNNGDLPDFLLQGMNVVAQIIQKYGSTSNK